MKLKVVMRLFEESNDKSFDKEDRNRFKRVAKIIDRIPVKTFGKLFIKNNDYEFYRGFCLGQEIKNILDENEYEIVRAVIDNINCGYYE